METANAPGPVAELLTDNEPVSIPVYGWTISTPPPRIKGPNQYRSSPSEPQQRTTAATKLFTAQTISAVAPSTSELSIYGTAPDVRAANGATFWRLKENDVLAINVGLSVPLDLVVEVEMAGVIPEGSTEPRSQYSAAWAGNQVNNIVPEWKIVTNPNWHTVSLNIPAGDCAASGNVFSIQSSDICGLWVKSITVKPVVESVTASFFWNCISENHLTQGMSQDKEISYTSGLTNSNTETREFSLAMGVTGELKALGANLTATFSNTQSHTISLDNSTTVSTTIEMACPANAKSRTFQIWQLNMRFHARQYTIVQALSHGKAPLYTRIFDEPATN